MIAAVFTTIDQQRHAHQQVLAATDEAFREAAFALDQFPKGTASPASDAAYSAFRELAGQRSPSIDRLDDLARLDTLVREFVNQMLPGKLVGGNQWNPASNRSWTAQGRRST